MYALRWYEGTIAEEYLGRLGMRVYDGSFDFARTYSTRELAEYDADSALFTEERGNGWKVVEVDA